MKLFLVTVALCALGGIATFGVILYISYDLPQINSLADYNPPIPSRIYSKDGHLLVELAKERRDIAAIDEIPQSIIDAFLAAEDDNFYNHSGIDYVGIARAMLKNIKAGRIVQGASTITQQVAKSLLLSSERTFSRKIKDLLLAQKIEEKFTKQEILFLYLNQVYLGGGYYGIKSAFRGYYDKELSEATVAETALIAGLLVAPGKYSPYVNPKYAKNRQRYVLGRLFKTGKITKAIYDNALDESIRIKRRVPQKMKAGYFTDWIRQRLIKNLGKEEFLTNGYEVVTTIDWELQKKAEYEILKGLKGIDKRQGYKGALEHIKAEEVESFITKQRKDLYKSSSSHFIFNPEGTNTPEFSFIENEREEDKQREAEVLEALKSYQRKSFEVGSSSKDKIWNVLKLEKPVRAVVTKISDSQKVIYANYAGVKVLIPEKGFKWAHKRNISDERNYWSYIKRPSSILKVGDIILVRIEKKKLVSGWSKLNKEFRAKLKNEKLIRKYKSQKFLIADLDQEVDVQGALLSISAKTGDILAMVGGSNFDKSQFNRVVQSNRQPGSAFKPLIFAAGLEHGHTASSLLLDTPQALGGVDDESLSWKPRNYDGKFKGSMTFRRALETSRNIPTIKLTRDVGVQNIINFVERLDLDVDLPEDLSLSLGSFGINLLNLVKLYSIFPNGGRNIKLRSIVSIKDRFGKVHHLMDESKDEEETGGVEEKKINEEEIGEVEEESSQKANPYLVNLNEKQVYDKRLSYIMSNLLKGVIQNGTGKGARDVSSFIGGKTGTTNNYVDAWFLGFSSKMVTGVWTGFDDNQTLGWGETGAKSALPIWKEFMKLGIKRLGESDFQIPSGIVNVVVDKETGRLSEENGFVESFVEGTEPGSANKESDENSQDDDSMLDDEDYYIAQ